MARTTTLPTLDTATGERLDELTRRCLGTPGVAFEAMASGLGNRRFVRIRLAEGNLRSVIARIEEPEDPALRPAGVAPEPALEPLRTFLEEAGLPVPMSYGQDESQQIYLLEDLGSQNLEQALSAADHARRKALIQEACMWVPRLQRLSPRDDIPCFGRKLDATLFHYKAEQVIDWVLPRAQTRPAAIDGAEVVRSAFKYVADECRTAPPRLAHRDYQSTNLHIRPAGTPGAEIAMIDFQGAFMAPPEYDLVCLLRDPHAALSLEEVEVHLEKIRPDLPDSPTRQECLRRFNLLTLTRCGKDLARYFYAAETRGDDRFIDLQSRLVRSLQSASQAVASLHPSLANLAELLDALPPGPTQHPPEEAEPCGP